VAERLGRSHLPLGFAFSSRLWYSRHVHSSNPDPDIQPDALPTGAGMNGAASWQQETTPTPTDVKANTTEAIKERRFATTGI
jgi:hypothetical protein